MGAGASTGAAANAGTCGGAGAGAAASAGTGIDATVGADVAAPAYGRPQLMELPPLALNREEALGYVGYAGQEMDDHLRERFGALAEACERGLKPACVWALYQVDEARTRWAGDEEESRVEESASGASTGSPADAPASAAPQQRDAAAAHPQPATAAPCVALVGCALVLPGRDIARHLRGAREVALMACTLGAESERELRKHGTLSPTDGLLYSAAASALVEAAANAAEARIVAEAAARGLRTNWRFSPGYGDLPLSVQPAFVRALDATRRAGIVVNPGGLMVPTKSITAVVGLFGPDAASTAADADADTGMRSRCDVCQLKGCCELRRRGTTCHGR